MTEINGRVHILKRSENVICDSEKVRLKHEELQYKHMIISVIKRAHEFNKESGSLAEGGLVLPTESTSIMKRFIPAC